MNFVLDFILVVIMVAIIFASYNKGFVASLLSLASVIVSSVCAWLFHLPLAEYISLKFISKPIVSLLVDKISSFSKNNDLDIMLREMPDGLRNFLHNIGADPEAISAGFEAAEITSGEYINSIASELGASVAHAISIGIALLLIYIVVYTVCLIASFAINSIFKLPLLKQANKLLSLCLGLACALIFAWFFSHFSVNVIDGLELLDTDSAGFSLLKSSYLIRLFYNINPFNIFSH